MLKGYPAKYIYEPWTAPESVQRAAKCIIGKDYPVPMVNHAEVSKLNTGRMKQVYQQLAVYASIGNCLTVDRQTDSRYVLILETIYLLITWLWPELSIQQFQVGNYRGFINFYLLINYQFICGFC